MIRRLALRLALSYVIRRSIRSALARRGVRS